MQLWFLLKYFGKTIYNMFYHPPNGKDGTSEALNWPVINKDQSQLKKAHCLWCRGFSVNYTFCPFQWRQSKEEYIRGVGDYTLMWVLHEKLLN